MTVERRSIEEEPTNNDQSSNHPKLKLDESGLILASNPDLNSATPEGSQKAIFTELNVLKQITSSSISNQDKDAQKAAAIYVDSEGESAVKLIDKNESSIGSAGADSQELFASPTMNKTDEKAKELEDVLKQQDDHLL